MIRKHVDIIAIATLFAVLALYSEARDSGLIQFVSGQRIALARNAVRRLASLSRETVLPSLCPLTYFR